MEDDGVADADIGDGGADLVHPAGVLVAEDVGQRGAHPAVPLAFDDVQVGPAYPGAADLHDDIEGMRDLRFWDLVDDWCLVEFVDSYCFHGGRFLPDQNLGTAVVGSLVRWSSPLG